MSICNCANRCSCTVWAIIASAILGVLAAFFQITGVVAVTTAFLWVVFGIAVVYLAVLVAVSAFAGRTRQCGCTVVNALLAGILGAILTAVVLLAVGIVATSILSAILVGILVFFFALIFAASACFVRCLNDCGE